MTRKSRLTPAQARFVRRAFKLRVRLTNKALAAKYDVHENTIRAHGYGERKA